MNGKTIHPYVGVTHEFTRGDYHVFCYSAYNAMGLIGSESNGICVCNVKRKDVVCDEIAKEQTGYFGPSTQRLEVFEKMRAMEDEEFYRFVNAQRRLRYNIPFKRTRGIAKDKVIYALAKLATTEKIAYHHQNKETFHALAKRACKQIAEALGLPKGSYDIRSNMGGIAVSGEVTLHAEHIYIQLGVGMLAGAFMYRSCKSRKDYSGGRNCWMLWEELASDFPAAIAKFKREMESEGGKFFVD